VANVGTVFHARLDDGKLWPFSLDDVRRQRILAYEFREIIWDYRPALTDDEAELVQSRVRQPDATPRLDDATRERLVNGAWDEA
jgi:hypothetical protein